MSLSQDGFSFLSAKHGPITPAAPLELPIAVGQFMGVLGESHIVGEPLGREISCDLTLDGYSTKADLDNAVADLDEQVGQLTGSITEVHGAGTTTWQQCTFLGFQPTGEPFRDGSGVNGWCQFGRLLWRQRKRFT